MSILVCVGTRPELIKINPLVYELNKNNIKNEILFTGQHKDLVSELNCGYELTIRDGENRLDSIVESIMNAFDNDMLGFDHVLVQGDTTSAMAVALAAFHRKKTVIHLEAGLRTYNKKNPYPEETNRRIISSIADIHLCPTKISVNNLKNEHVEGRIFQVGNTVLDNLVDYKNKSEYTDTVLVTLHRRENYNLLEKYFIEINNLAIKYPHIEFIFPIHPSPDVQKHKDLLKNVKVVNPLSHAELINILIKTKMVITDSGGLQEESSFFNKVCLVCRKETEREETIGTTSYLVKEPEMLSNLFEKNINNYMRKYLCPYGDGNASKIIVKLYKDGLFNI